jgi:hypothetical protein
VFSDDRKREKGRKRRIGGRSAAEKEERKENSRRLTFIFVIPTINFFYTIQLLFTVFLAFSP